MANQTADPNREAPENPEIESAPIELDAEDARQGEIILRTRRRRVVFVGGLVAIIVLVLAATLIAAA